MVGRGKGREGKGREGKRREGREGRERNGRDGKEREWKILGFDRIQCVKSWVLIAFSGGMVRNGREGFDPNPCQYNFKTIIGMRHSVLKMPHANNCFEILKEDKGRVLKLV